MALGERYGTRQGQDDDEAQGCDGRNRAEEEDACLKRRNAVDLVLRRGTAREDGQDEADQDSCHREGG